MLCRQRCLDKLLGRDFLVVLLYRSGLSLDVYFSAVVESRLYNQQPASGGSCTNFDIASVVVIRRFSGYEHSAAFRPVDIQRISPVNLKIALKISAAQRIEVRVDVVFKDFVFVLRELLSVGEIRVRVSVGFRKSGGRERGQVRRVLDVGPVNGSGTDGEI